MSLPSRLLLLLALILALLLASGVLAWQVLADDQGGRRTALSVLLALSAIAAGAGTALGCKLFARDARARREQEAQARLGCFYEALSRTNRLIVREHDEQTLYDEICRICVETGHAFVACIWSIEDGRVAPVASAGATAAGLLQGVNPAPVSELRKMSSPFGIVLREGRPGISNDYLADPHAARWREGARAQGIRSMAAYPLQRGGVTVGVLSFYADQVGFFDEPLVHLLGDMSTDLSYALDAIDRETARRAALREVQQGHERMRHVFNLLPMAITILDEADNRVLEVNDAVCQRYAQTREQMLGRTMAEVGIGLSDSDRDAFRAALRDGGAVRGLEVGARGADGQALVLLISADRLEFMGRRAILIATLDVTEIQHARRAQLEAEVASRAKTEFLSRMSHELRTPLNAVLGFAQLLQSDVQESLSARQQGQVEVIRQAGWHLLALINDVLDVSRIESGQLQIEMRSVALGGVIEEVLQLLQPRADGAGVTLTAVYRDRAAWASADPLRLRQVLLNLVSNAVKYNRPGGSVTVDVHDDADEIEIVVADTGLGMTRDQLAHLYQPFNRLGRERGGIEGTGIGLALTRQLLDLMQGGLEIESEAGKGTTVRVRLPRAAAQLPPAEPVAHRLALPAGTAPEPAGTVLYIEDNPVNVMLVEQLLGRWPQVRFAHADDGGRGIKLARSMQPDLILLDMRLSDMDGLQVLDALQADPATRGLCVVMLSASAMPAEIEHARRGGARDYWTKPLDFDRFIDGVRRMLREPVGQ